MDKPDLKTVPDSAPDPFKDPSVPISDVYGWAWRFTNYDLGCGNDFIRDPAAVTTTTSANFVIAWMNTLNSAIASIEHMAHTATLDWLEKVVVAIANTLTTRVLTVWLPLAAVLLAVIVAVFTPDKASYADTLRRLGTLAGRDRARRPYPGAAPADHRPGRARPSTPPPARPRPDSAPTPPIW